MEGNQVPALAALAALNEPLRRRIYGLTAASVDGVSRDGAAQALAIPRSVAAFHLDKLVEAGLLVADYRRPPGRRGGPGAGRPAKWYRRAEGEVSWSVPDRRYGLAARLLAQAVERSEADGVPVGAALRAVAREEGHRLGAGLAPQGASPASVRKRLVEVLEANGYEPRTAGGMVTLGNCPFHLLAEAHRKLVCTMNHELLSGLAEAAGLPEGSARLDPGPDRCCVTVAA